ncbi:putative DNA polymerase eta [Leishmania major strain Friedlin]|uniref:Putative DNA polymerase eta n=1 Tax=Leishmania major TaxID=5664 RepID=Q4QCF3_LEIMA|nr:putative DNA polymerase eta [Leishmania major strain Friedlin]CAG9573351.1 DNA_polymerase_eta_-_putative [Leishmania major strain Friedlin]CAJ04131.1 putative DNA polymerase eta [Leishmania major strain Friedlin]|eukprot:XP_001682995.1 putative DNA polymerase eta [Leishmania major strain Friedlin]
MLSRCGAGPSDTGEDARCRSSPRVSCLCSADAMRCIAHMDMDCFYAQVEAVRLGVDCRVTPFALVQWGSFIAVNYPARARGVRRFCLSPDEVRRELPDVRMSHIATYAMGESEYCYPEAPHINTHKVSLEPYRHASRQIFAILRAEPGVVVGKAGIDEAYVDVTEAARRELAEVRAAAAGASLDPLEDVMEPSTRLIEDRRAEMEAWLSARGTSLAAVFDEPMRALVRGECGAELEGSRAFCVGADDAAYAERCLLLCAASRVVHRLRQRIYAELHYDCSAGIAHNRVLAKCISATHKPNQQTLLLPDRSASALFELPLSGLRGFGGKLGAAVSAVCGGVTECREAWLVPLAQLRKLDGTCDAGDGEDAEGDREGHVDEASAACRGDTKVDNGGGGEDGMVAQSRTGVYAFYRLRGLGSDTVADPALPRGMKASKIFHPACSSWSAAQLWMAPLAGELWHRLSEYESCYHKEGRSLVLVLRAYVTPEQARRGQHTRSYRAQVPLPTNVRDASEIAGMGLREFVKLMREVTTRGKEGERRPGSPAPLPSQHIPTNPPSEAPDAPTGIAVPSSGVLTMPPLHVIELSIIGLRLRPLQATEGGNDGITGHADGGTLASSQRSLTDMFSALSASAAGSVRTAVPGGGSPRKRHRNGTRDGEVAHGRGRGVVVEIDDSDEDENVSDDCVDFDVHLGEATEGKRSDTPSHRGQSAGPAGASSPPLMRTLDDLFCRATAAPSASAAETASVPTRAVRQVTTVCVEEDNAVVWVPQQSCVSFTEVSSEEDEAIS